MAAPQGPLVGLRVLDFTIYANGPSATQKLCDGGAEVVKVEVAEGAPERIQSAYITPDGYRWLHGHLNRGKKSIVVDLKHPRAAEVLEPLVKWADVIANNFRAGGLERLGLSYERCRRWNPGVIYTSNSGFGPAGEWAEKPSFDGIAQAFSGAMVEAGGGPTQGT